MIEGLISAEQARKELTSKKLTERDSCISDEILVSRINEQIKFGSNFFKAIITKLQEDELIKLGYSVMPLTVSNPSIDLHSEIYVGTEISW